MKVETRIFKHAIHLLLISETKKEARAIDLIIGEAIGSPIKIQGELCTDDYFNPYLRFKKP